METKKYYVKKELILEIEVEQNPEKVFEPDVPINPKDCRLEWTGTGNLDWMEHLNSKIKINPEDLHVMEDAMTRCHEVKSVRLIDEGPRKSWMGASEWGMSEDLVWEQKYVSKEVYDHDLDDLDAYDDSDNVTPLPKTVSYWKLMHLHLPHEIVGQGGQDWYQELWDRDPVAREDGGYYYNDKHRFFVGIPPEPPEPERTETDLTDFMPKDEIDDVSSKSVILEVIEGGKSTEK